MADISKIKLPDNNEYNIKDANAMPKSGGTFTGDVTLNGDPTTNLMAATKHYVDDKAKVSGVKGAAQSNYRTGNVNLTAYQIQAYQKGQTIAHKVQSTSYDPSYLVAASQASRLNYQYLHSDSGISNLFYAVNLNPDYTVTCNYSGTHGIKGNVDIGKLFNGNPNNYIVLDTDSIAQTPFVLEITKNSGNIGATDVAHLQFARYAHADAASRLTDYKVQLYTTGSTASSGTKSWVTVYQRTGVSDKLNELAIALNPTSYSYLVYSGIRLTISGATPISTTSGNQWEKAIDIASFALMRVSGNSAARSIGALDIAGGEMYGPATFYGGITANSYGGSGVDTTISAGSNSTNIPTSQAVANLISTIGLQANSIYVSQVSGSTPTIAGQPNMRYICGTVTSISITPPNVGTVDVRFTSGTTPAVLTLPNTVKMPEWFDTTVLETNTIYEILISDGVYGSVMTWPA